MDMFRFSKNIIYAIEYATRMHSGQKRKNGEDYILHPLHVATKLMEAGQDEKTIITGLFHDLLEDTEAKEEDIAKFGEDVLHSVKLLSKNYAENSKSYIDNILVDNMAKVVKNYDRIDNIADCMKLDNIWFSVRYLSDSEKFYLNRFSKEMDEHIGQLKDQVMSKVNADFNESSVIDKYKCGRNLIYYHCKEGVYRKTKYGYIKAYPDRLSLVLDHNECELERI